MANTDLQPHQQLKPVSLPLLSVVTPEHSARNAATLLVEVFDSLISQTYENWEWIIYVNGSCCKSDIPTKLLNHARVRISDAGNTNHNGTIGAIRHAAFSHANGEYIIEVDHDDLLLPNCLSEIYEAFQENPNAGFVFSNNAKFDMQGGFSPYSATYGWRYRMFDWHSTKYGSLRLVEMDTFKPSSHSVSFIWFAPDHVRAWRRSLYQELGGHSHILPVCDDHDLMIRAYMKTMFYHIPKVLYIYRITGNNTSLQRNREIQITTMKLFQQYAQQLAERDADKRGLKKIDLGGGVNPRAGYITIDLHNSDMIYDLNNGIPLSDNSVGVIHANHILQYLRDPVKIISEIHRVLAHGGWVFIEVPSTDGRGAFQDPNNASYWNENSFLYYTDACFAKYIKNEGMRFQKYRMETFYPTAQCEKLKMCITQAWLVALKDDDSTRFPGVLEI